LRPLAIEWGGQVFVDNKQSQSFAFGLATSLTTVCSALDVELVTEHNIGVVPYWGQVGHYSIASFACKALPEGTLKDFMMANLDRISFGFENLNKKDIKLRLKKAREKVSLVPLADVPDEVWKKYYKSVKGGRDTKIVDHRTTGPEHPTHYADIDEHKSHEKSLREQCLEDHDKIRVDFWQQFYDEHGHTEQRDRGLLPFRVWQFFEQMKDFLGNNQISEFLCAAGLLSHYVGDACQPLHGSIFADGDPETGEGKGVHSTYETTLIEMKQGPLVAGIETAINQPGAHIPHTVEVRKQLWKKFGPQTISVMTDGAKVLARLWEGAWTEGKGGLIPVNELGPIDPEILNGHSRNPEFVESFDLDHIKPHLKGHP
jgi:hypothetical protein